jgi:peptidoglycan/LPS O-acetylase OafA/YrhL
LELAFFIMPQGAALTQTRTTYFPALTGIRAVAAYLVFAGHTNVGKEFLPPFLFMMIKMAGHCSLAVFFVLSSFVISTRYATSFQTANEGFGRYYIRRFARIYPLFFVVTLVVLFLQGDFNGWHWFLNFTFLKSFFHFDVFSGVSQAWSLTVEECFYLTAPLLFIGFRRFPWQTLALIFLFGFGLVFIGKQFPGSGFVPTIGYLLDFTFFGRCFEFYCGYRLAQYFSKKDLKSPPEKRWYRLTFAGMAWMFLCLLLIVYFLHQQVVLFPGFSIGITTLINNFLFPAGVCLFFYGLLTETTLVSRVLSSRPVRFLGKNSFGFSLLHGGIIFEVLYFHVSENKFIIFLMINVLAAIAYHFFEEPVNQYIRRKTAKKLPESEPALV